MAKRLFDIVFSVAVLALTAPIMVTALFLVWAQDRHSPIFRARRVGRGDSDFTMMKIRSMRIGADRTGVNSTSAGDNRVTQVGRFIRRFKLDELSQFWNVVKGDMSVVGPRPNTRAHGVDLYTPLEMKLLSVRPGITDLSSIVFSDEGEILQGAADADARYNQVIRPWKSRLGLLYVANASVGLDLRIAWLTAVAIFSRSRALAGVNRILVRLAADPELIEICLRRAPLCPAPPPGAKASGARETSRRRSAA
jgi:lipopolysaccharide/colanic/teichoic acid biosynthesis glycosyltransferase